MLKNLIDINEAGKMLNMRTSRIRYEVFLKRIPHFKIGRSIRFSVEELNQWILGQREQVKSKEQK